MIQAYLWHHIFHIIFKSSWPVCVSLWHCFCASMFHHGYTWCHKVSNSCYGYIRMEKAPRNDKSIWRNIHFNHSIFHRIFSLPLNWSFLYHQFQVTLLFLFLMISKRNRKLATAISAISCHTPDMSILLKI